jgi:hypothetical protein
LAIVDAANQTDVGGNRTHGLGGLAELKIVA